ncbi:MAG: hypothetical protein AAF149_17320, partial [Bacteroidota bacterium]
YLVVTSLNFYRLMALRIIDFNIFKDWKKQRFTVIRRTIVSDFKIRNIFNKIPNMGMLKISLKV